LKGVFILRCEMQQTYTCYDQRRFCHVSVIIIVGNIKWNTSKVWKCTNQQRSAILKHIIKCFSCLPLSLTYFLVTNQSFDQCPSAGCLTSCHSDVDSTHQYLVQNFNRHAFVAMLIFCNLAILKLEFTPNKCAKERHPLSRAKIGPIIRHTLGMVQDRR